MYDIVRMARKVTIAHLDKTIAHLESDLGPMLLMYEMAARLDSVDPYTLNLDTGPVENTARVWRALCDLRRERAGRLKLPWRGKGDDK